MKSRLQRYRALEAALEKLKTARTRDLGRAMLRRKELLEERSAIEEALCTHELLGDLMLPSRVRQIARIAANLQTSDAAIAALRRTAMDLTIRAKRAHVLATQAKRQAELQMARIQLAELTDQDAGGNDSLPQGKMF
jgi:hypothetical protein